MKTVTAITMAALALGMTWSLSATARDSSNPHSLIFTSPKFAQAQPMPMQQGMPGQYRGGPGMNPGQMQGRGMNTQQMPGAGGMPWGNMGPSGMSGAGMMPFAMMQMMGGNCPGVAIMMGQEAGPAYTSGRIAFLRAELAINDKQKNAFEAYANALTKNIESMTAMRSNMITMTQAATPLDRVNAQLTTMEARIKALKDLKPALENLYKVLDEGQKSKANQILTGMGCMM